jgi:hypothetical protein
MKNKSILNVVRHQGGKLRLGVICGEFKREPLPREIIIKGIPGCDKPLSVNPSRAYYKYGSIYHQKIDSWLEEDYYREAGEPIFLLKFYYSGMGRKHIYSYMGDSMYKKVPYRRILISPKGNREPMSEDFIEKLWLEE